MNRTQLITRILKHRVFIEKPPVLVDVGASGEIHKEWALIAPYAVCLAFDGDDRELKVIETTNGAYKKLLLYHCILTAQPQETAEFHLTRSPYCSSLLKPDLKSLASYSFRDLFQVEKTVSLKAVTLSEVLSENNLDYVDWFKTDSQGTDLRLFQSLPESVIPGVKIAEFEPGVIDAYCGEDKFGDLLKWMQGKPFFLHDLHVESVFRIDPEIMNLFPHHGFVRRRIKKTPGWINALYMNTGEEIDSWSFRDGLFFLICCIMQKQYGMSYKFSSILERRFPDEKIFTVIRSFSKDQLDPGFILNICLKVGTFLLRGTRRLLHR